MHHQMKIIVSGGRGPAGTGVPISESLTYSGLVSQSSVNAPTVKILENTFGNIAWTYYSQGMYKGTLVGGFPLDKTNIQNLFYTKFIQYGIDYVNGFYSFYEYGLIRLNDNECMLMSAYDDGNKGNDLLTDTFIEIKRYL